MDIVCAINPGITHCAALIDQNMTRKNWLQSGLEELARAGLDGLKVERICEAVGKTRGSFYHHFKDHHAFVVALLEYWQESSTANIIKAVEGISDPCKRRAALAMRVIELSSNCENAIRGWATTDERARAIVALVDDKRLEFLQHGILEMATEMGVNISTRQAKDLAMLDYGLFIGVLALKPEGSPEYFLGLNILSEEMLVAWMERNGK